MIVNKYNQGGGGSSSGVTPQDVQAQIDSALTPYWESGETKDYVDGAVSGISLEGYATSGEMQSAFTLISETQQVAAAGLNQLEGRIDELSAATPSIDLSGYYTSGQTEEAISSALTPYYTSAQTDERISSAYTILDEHITEVEQVTASALTELHEDLLEVSARTVDMSGYWDSATTKDYVDEAVSGLATEQYVQDALSGVSLEGYATSGEMQSAFTLISETQQVAAAGLNQLEGRIDELSGNTPDMSLYTPTSGFSTINGSAITNGGNIVIEGGSSAYEIELSTPCPDDFTEDDIAALNAFFTAYMADPSIAEGAYLKNGENFYRCTGVIDDSVISAGTFYFVCSYVEYAYKIHITFDQGEYLEGIRYEWSSETLIPFSEFPADPAEGQITNYDDGNGNIGLYRYDGTDWVPYAPDMSGYYTSAQTEEAISAATSGKADATALTAYTPTTGFSTINGSAITNGGNIVIQGGSADMSAYYTSAQTEDAISSALTPYYTSAQTNMAIASATQDMVTSTDIDTIWKGTQAEYDTETQSGATAQPNTFYIILPSA